MKKLINSVIAIILCICMLVPVYGYAAAASLGQVKNLKVKKTTTNSATLSWNKVSGAKSYRVYRYDSSEDKWVYEKKTSSTSTTVTGLSSAKTYKFRVRVYNNKNNKGKYSSTVKAVTRPKKVSSLSASSLSTSSVKLSWSSVTRATGYKVYRYNSSTNAWKMIKKTTSKSYNVTGLTAGTTYKFMVRAYYTSGDTTRNSGDSSTLTVVTTPSKVQNLKVTNIGASSYTLTWDKVANAEKYDVYRYETSGWKKLATTAAVSYTVTNASTASTSYKVRAVKTNGSDKVNGAFSATVKAQAKGQTSTPVPAPDPSPAPMPTPTPTPTPDPGVTVPKAPENLSLVAVPGESISISWDEVDGAKGYQVYMYTGSGNDWTRIRTTTGTSINHSVDKTGTYHFIVRSYITVNGENIYSEFSKQSEVYYMSGDEGETDSILGNLEKTGLLGYLYDPVYHCFYTAENPWQRNFGFTPVYDYCAPFTIMFYDTVRLKFEYDGLEWMIQIWKGQYGWVFIGAEIGVYTRESKLPLDFYECASDENMLDMSMVVLQGENTIITRPYDRYWWCTGFVPGILPSAIVGAVAGDIDTSPLTMNARITLKDKTMREAFCEALDKNGFVLNKDYIYAGNDVIFTWT